MSRNNGVPGGVLWLREEMIEDDRRCSFEPGIVGSVAVVFVPSRRVSGVVQAGHRSLVIEGLTAQIMSRPIAMPDISNSISVAIKVNPRVFRVGSIVFSLLLRGVDLPLPGP
jgi:hypothetical protein